MTRRRSTARRTPARGGQQGYEPPVTRMRRDERILDLALERWSHKYFCRSTSTILAGSDGCSFDDAPFGGRCCGF